MYGNRITIIDGGTVAAPPRLARVLGENPLSVPDTGAAADVPHSQWIDMGGITCFSDEACAPGFVELVALPGDIDP